MGPKLELLRSFGPPAPDGRRITLRYGLAVDAIDGDDTVRGVTFTRTGRRADDAEPRERIDAGLVVASIGYRGMPVAGLPFDDATGTVTNDGGRVVAPTTGDVVAGTYVVGWIKRGPSGFIGTNKACSQDTVLALVEDYNAGRLASPSGASAGDRGRSHRSPAAV